MSELSVIIITQNEENNIRRCLESVKWADEIVVVDSGSIDNTVDICREYTDKVSQTTWHGYGQQKNIALAQATRTWVLSLDADEEVSIALRDKIQQILQADQGYDAYAIKRPVVFLGQIIKHACGADNSIRLFKRKHGHFTNVIVHETIKIDGRVRKLSQPILHYSFANVAAIIEKMNRYTSLVAQQRAAIGKKSSLFKAVTRSMWMFIKVYLLKGGFLDGRAGFILSVSFAEGSYYRYVKLLTLE